MWLAFSLEQRLGILWYEWYEQRGSTNGGKETMQQVKTPNTTHKLKSAHGWNQGLVVKLTGGLPCWYSYPV